MSPLPQRTSDGARLRLVPAVIRQYSKFMPAAHLLAPQRFRQLALGGAGRVLGHHRLHRLHDALGGLAQHGEFVGTLARAQPLQHHHRVFHVRFREGAAQRHGGIGRQERHLHADVARGDPGAAQIGDRLLHGVERAVGGGLGRAGPERRHLGLEFLQPVADVGGLVAPALGIDDDRQVAAQARWHPCSRRTSSDARPAGTARCAWSWRPAHRCRRSPSAGRADRHRREWRRSGSAVLSRAWLHAPWRFGPGRSLQQSVGTGKVRTARTPLTGHRPHPGSLPRFSRAPAREPGRELSGTS